MMDRLKSRISDLLLPTRRGMSALDCLIAGAGSAHVAARRALALAVAEEDREIARRGVLSDSAKDLEARAIEALAGGREDLAQKAAEAIAAIETEVGASSVASERFAAKVAVARREVDAQRRRLADLDRGRRLARVGAALNSAPLDGRPLLDRAEAALNEVEATQADAEAIRLEFAPPSGKLVEDMADAGFGRPTRVLASEVLDRLRAFAQSAQPSERLTRA
jgi:phage shock protein A